jgi:PAP2 superfamily
MRPGELLALGYFLAVVVAALALASRRPQWPRSLAWAATGLLVAVTAPLAPLIWVFDVAVELRDWWLLAALPAAYWAPAPLAGVPREDLERWLRTVDDRLGIAPHTRAAGPLLEVAYLLVYPMVPAGLAAILVTGDQAARTAFWPAVLIAVLPCYGLLPLLPTRPPRALLLPASSTAPAARAGARHVNVTFLSIFGVGWNTLPSGHAAGAVAVAVLVWRSGSPLAPLVALVAVGIALGTVRGRYHYAVDTVLGVMLGLAAGLSG